MRTLTQGRYSVRYKGCWMYNDHAETVAGKPVDFRKTRLHDLAHQSEAESTNEKNGGNKWRDDGAAF